MSQHSFWDWAPNPRVRLQEGTCDAWGAGTYNLPPGKKKCRERSGGRGELTLQSGGDEGLAPAPARFPVSSMRTTPKPARALLLLTGSASLADGMAPSDGGGTSFCVCDKETRS